MVTTSANALPNGRKTGVWLEEIAVPYLILEKAGMTITIASPKGGAVPLDPHSLDEASVAKWSGIMDLLKTSAPLNSVEAAGFEAIFLPGWPRHHDGFCHRCRTETAVARICKSQQDYCRSLPRPCRFGGRKKARRHATGVSGKTITAFTDEEETGVQLESCALYA